MTVDDAPPDDLRAAGATLGAMAPPPGAALEAALGALAAVAPRRPWREVALVGGVGLAIGALVVGVFGVRRDLGELPPAFVVGAAALWLLVAAAALVLALVPRAGAVLPRTRAAGAIAAAAAAAMVGFGLAVHPHGPSSLSLGAAGFARGHTCLEAGLAIALVPVVLAVLTLRRVAPRGARGLAAGIGAAAGALGGLALHLHCPIADALHLGVMHGGVVASAALLATAIAPRALRP